MRPEEGEWGKKRERESERGREKGMECSSEREREREEERGIKQADKGKSCIECTYSEKVKSSTGTWLHFYGVGIRLYCNQKLYLHTHTHTLKNYKWTAEMIRSQ